MLILPRLRAMLPILRSGCSAARLARFVRDEEAGGSNPLTPTIFRNEPFGERVKGLSHCGGLGLRRRG